MNVEAPISRREFSRICAIAGLALLHASSPHLAGPDWTFPGLADNSHLLLSDLHYGQYDSRNPRSNPLAALAVSELISSLKNRSIIDAFILGDVTQEQPHQPQANLANYRYCQSLFGRFPFPVYSVLGNHELYGLPAGQFPPAVSQPGLCDYSDYRVIRISPELLSNGLSHIPDSVMAWLEKTCQPDIPLILLTHLPLGPIEYTNKYFSVADPRPAVLANSAELWNIIVKSVFLVISGHLHQIYNWPKDSHFPHRISLPAVEDGQPVSYGILSVADPLHYCLNIYSRGLPLASFAAG